MTTDPILKDATEEELFSDYKLFESSLRQLLGDETANTILTFLHNEMVNWLPHKRAIWRSIRFL